MKPLRRRIALALVSWAGLLVPSVVFEGPRWAGFALASLATWYAVVLLGPGLEAGLSDLATTSASVRRAIRTSLGIWLGFAVIVTAVFVVAEWQAAGTHPALESGPGQGLAMVFLLAMLFVLPISAAVVATLVSKWRSSRSTESAPVP